MPPDPQISSQDLSEDLLVLSQCSYRLYMLGQPRWKEFRGLAPTKDDRIIANNMKQYYLGRLTFKMLSGQPLSDYQNCLYQFLSTGSISASKVGLVYRLPYFYVEDNKRDKIKEQSYEAQNCDPKTTNVSLRYIDTIFKSRRGRDAYEFWFFDQQRCPYMLSVVSDNPLLSLLQSLTEGNDEFVSYSANLYYQSNNHINLPYYKIVNLKRIQ